MTYVTLIKEIVYQFDVSMMFNICIITLLEYEFVNFVLKMTPANYWNDLYLISINTFFFPQFQIKVEFYGILLFVWFFYMYI